MGPSPKIVRATVALLAVGAILAGCSTSSNSSPPPPPPAASSGHANIYVVASKSNCFEVQSDASIYTTVVLHNSGTKAGSTSVDVDYRYNDGGDTVDGLADDVTVDPGQTYYARFKHNYDALHHDVVECAASTNKFDSQVDISVLPPQ